MQHVLQRSQRQLPGLLPLQPLLERHDAGGLVPEAHLAALLVLDKVRRQNVALRPPRPKQHDQLAVPRVPSLRPQLPQGQQPGIATGLHDVVRLPGATRHGQRCAQSAGTDRFLDVVELGIDGPARVVLVGTDVIHRQLDLVFKLVPVVPRISSARQVARVVAWIADLERLDGEVSKANRRISELQNFVNTKEQLLEAKDVSLREKDDEIESLKTSCSNADSHIFELESELKSKTIELEATQLNIEAENTELKEYIFSLGTECRSHQAAVDSQEKEIERLRKDLLDAEQEAELLADEILRFQRERAESEKERSILRQKFENLNERRQDQEEALTFLQKRVLELDISTSPEVDPLSVVAAKPKQQRLERSKQVTAKASELLSRRKASSLTIPSLSTKRALEKSLRTSAAVLLIENVLHSKEKAELGSALRQWSTNTNTTRVVSHHIQVAEVMNRQLHMTRSKLAALKSHLKAKR